MSTHSNTELATATASAYNNSVVVPTVYCPNIENVTFIQLQTSPAYTLSKSWATPTGFFGTLSGVPNNSYTSTFVGVSGVSINGANKSMISNAYLYISSSFDINYNFSSGAPGTYYDPPNTRQPPPADKTALKIYLYKADNFIE